MGKSSSSGVVWQVVAPVVRWPLWSPARLGLVLAAIVAACLALSLVNGDDVGAATPAPSVPTAVVTTPTPSVTTITVAPRTEGYG